MKTLDRKKIAVIKEITEEIIPGIKATPYINNGIVESHRYCLCGCGLLATVDLSKEVNGVTMNYRSSNKPECIRHVAKLMKSSAKFHAKKDSIKRKVKGNGMKLYLVIKGGLVLIVRAKSMKHALNLLKEDTPQHLVKFEPKHLILLNQNGPAEIIRPSI